MKWFAASLLILCLLFVFAAASSEGYATPTDLCMHTDVSFLFLDKGTEFAAASSEGYATPTDLCMHTDVSFLFIDEGTEIADDWNEAPNYFHSKKDYETYSITCDICGEILSTEREYTHIANERHQYSGGVCTLCGHTNTCTHEGSIADETVYTEFILIDADEENHTAHVSGYHSRYCTECLQTFETYDYFYSMKETRPHQFQGNRCKYCFYEKPAGDMNDPAPDIDAEDKAPDVSAKKEPMDHVIAKLFKDPETIGPADIPEANTEIQDGCILNIFLSISEDAAVTDPVAITLGADYMAELLSENIKEINIVINGQRYLSINPQAAYDLLTGRETGKSPVVIRFGLETNHYMGDALLVEVDAEEDMIQSIIDSGIISVYLKRNRAADEPFSGYRIAKGSILEVIENASLEETAQGPEYCCLPFSGNGIYTVFYFR